MKDLLISNHGGKGEGVNLQIIKERSENNNHVPNNTLSIN